MHSALTCVSTSLVTQVEAVDMDRSRGRTPYTVRLTAPGDVHMEQRWETIEEDDEVREVTGFRRHGVSGVTWAALGIAGGCL